MPFDVVRKRLQVQGPTRNSYIINGIPRYPKSFISTMYQIVKHEGLLGLWKGWVPGVMKAGPSSAVTFFTVEWCRDFFKKRRNHNKNN